MGTSKGYDAPKTPQWKKLKTTVTRTSAFGRATGGVSERVLGRYIGATREHGGTGGAGQYSSAQKTARRIGSFFNDVSLRGFSNTLKENGFGDLSGLTPTQIKLALMDYFCGDGSHLYDVDARDAFSDLFDEMFKDAKNYEDIDRVLGEILVGNEYLKFLTKFFGYFIYQSFCRSFYEKLIAKIGKDNAANYLRDIKDYIFSRIDGMKINKDISKIDWMGRDGCQRIEKICNDVLDIFGGE